jgi:UDP-2,3-diacylglucosamine pyrophosphatase LpxH
MWVFPLSSFTMDQNVSATSLLRRISPADERTSRPGFVFDDPSTVHTSPAPCALPSFGDPQNDHHDGADIEGVEHYRAIWISDIHLGSSGCQAPYLLDFLRHHESNYLYLVGDIIDGWQLKKGWYWPQAHNDVIQKIMRKARKGTHVIYVPWNHDEGARQFCGLAFGDIRVESEAFHETLTGKRLWVVHGDLFDGVIQHAKWLAYVGDTLYTMSLVLNRWFNRVRGRLGFGYWSLSQYLKQQVKNAVSFISSYERVMIEEATKWSC